MCKITFDIQKGIMKKKKIGFFFLINIIHHICGVLTKIFWGDFSTAQVVREYVVYGHWVLSCPLHRCALVNDYLLSINNEYFVKLTYIPLENLC